MRLLLEKVLLNYPYFAALILFAIGVMIVLTLPNVFKKLLGINIMQSSIFLMFIAAGNIRGGVAPLAEHAEPGVPYVNPVPSALILTGIVVSVSVTAFALALIIRLYRAYGTTDARRLLDMKSEMLNK